ncbi:ubiquinol-cytochrome c reductase iron-sulfur subunit [Larkinella terrae]|uniref:Rieske 2Fe-2S domain-containing protein n=1 Tax=Larkinella terrae TaxID=2025311 RepID=A0A7K0ESG6_9BACT|nr:Rieske (2Fe-2S) protein [Larkinella terrae]MRS64750.1 Rieske 2Fe-2S domain-containing protein [Larkinella terrae]
MKTTHQTLDRRTFFSLVGTSIGAIVLSNCLSSCSAPAEAVSPGPSTGGTTGGSTGLTLNLNDAANAKLKQNGGFLYKNGMIIARTKDGSFIAVSQVCTHAGVTVEFDAAGNRIHCPGHGSNFKNDGSIINGPAGSPLKAFKTTFDSTSNTLKIG